MKIILIFILSLLFIVFVHSTYFDNQEIINIEQKTNFTFNNITDTQLNICLVNISNVTLPKTRLQINLSELKILIDESVQPYLIMSKYIVDDKYELYDLNDIKSKLSNLSHSKYTKQIYDCDDFALQTMAYLKKELPGIAVGILVVSKTTKDKNYENTTIFSDVTNFTTENSSYYGTGEWRVIVHAVNIIIDSNYDVWYYEPQNNLFYPIDEREYQTVRRYFI